MKLILSNPPSVDHAKTGAGARAERVEAGLGLRPMASRMGISHTLLSMMERGAVRWNEEKAANFNQALLNP